MGAFVQLSRAIDGVTGLLGRWVSWLVLVAILGPTRTKVRP